MKIGVFSTFMSPNATPQMIRDFGRRAESMGLDSIWMGEHVVLFDKQTSGYPGSKDGRIPVPPGGGMLDVTATFGFLAAATSRLRLGTGVALVPQRNPIYTAKEICTLDWLSGGRIDFGIGVGWNKEEVEICGYRWEDRGARCDEFLEVIRQLWTEPVVDFRGKWVKFERLASTPTRSRSRTSRSSSVATRKPPTAAPCSSARAGTAPIAMRPERRRTSSSSTRPSPRQGASGPQTLRSSSRRPSSTPMDAMQAYGELGVHRLVVNLGGQRPERVDKRLPEIGALVKRRR